MYLVIIMILIAQEAQNPPCKQVQIKEQRYPQQWRLTFSYSNINNLSLQGSQLWPQPWIQQMESMKQIPDTS